MEVSVMDRPLSIVGAEGVMAPAVRTELTVTVTLAQKLAAGIPTLLSFTFTEKAVEVVRVPVKKDEEVAPERALIPTHPDPEYHW
jgi:hypothetical protein